MTELDPAQPDRLGLGDDVMTLSEPTAESVSDPLYQAFVATGFLRPR